MFSGLWAYVIGGIGALLIGTAAGAYGAHIYYTGEIETMKADYAAQDVARANAELKQFQDISKQIHDAAQTFITNQGLFGTKIDLISRDLKNVQAKTPLPKNCRPDVSRMRNLSSAIAAANAAIR